MSKKEKIAIILPSLKNLGPIIVMENIINNLFDKYEFILISLRKNEIADINNFKKFKIYELGMKKFPSFLTKNKLKKIIAKENIHIIHPNSYWPTILCRNINIKKVTTVHNDPYIDFTMEYGKLIGKKMAINFKKSLYKYDKIVCISQYVKEIINVPNSEVIYNSVEDLAIKNNVNVDFVSDKNFNLYTASVLNKRKNILRMIDIVDNLVKNNKNIKLYIIGDGSEKDKIISKIEEKKLQQNIILLGKKDKFYIKSLANVCDCFIFTSLNEGFGLVIAEAMRDEKYICCSDFEVAKELITDDIDGCICKENKDFEFYLNNLIELKNKKNKILKSNKNRKIYLNRYTNNVMGNNYDAVYTSLSKKNIMYYIPFFDVGGIESLVTKFIEKNKNKYNFYLLVEKDINKNIKEKLNESNVKICQIPNFKDNNLISYLKELVMVFKNNKIDIFHSHDYTLRFFPLLFSKIFGVKVRICHIHSSSLEGNKFIKIKKILVKINLLFANKIFACSKAAEKFVNNKRCVVVSNGIESENYIYNSKLREEIRGKYNFTADDIVIIQVGRLVPVKNYEFTLNLMKILGDKYKLLILGDGELRNEIEKKIKKDKLSKRVNIIGNVNNVNHYLSAADIFVLPSHFEGLPLTLLEAISSGINSIVSSNVTKEIEQFELINYVDLDIKTWKDCIENTILKNDRENYNKLVKESIYDISNFEKTLEAVYDKK